MQGFDDASPLGPARPGTSGEGDDGHFACAQGVEAELVKAGRQGGRLGGVEQVTCQHILDDGVGRQAVLGKTKAAGFQVRADLLVGFGVESEFLEEKGEGFFGGAFRRTAGQYRIKKRFNRPAEVRMAATGNGKVIELGQMVSCQLVARQAQQRRNAQAVIARWHERLGSHEQVRPSATLIDGKIIHDRCHGKGQGAFKGALGFRHDL